MLTFTKSNFHQVPFSQSPHVTFPPSPNRIPFLLMSHRAQSRCPVDFENKLIFKTSFFNPKYVTSSAVEMAKSLFSMISFLFSPSTTSLRYYITTSHRYSVTSSQRHNIFFLQLKFPCAFQLSQTQNLIILFLRQVIIDHKKGKIHHHRLLSHNDP